MDYPDVPDDAMAHVRTACLVLPETRETPAWTGSFFKVRQRTFAHVFAIDDPAGRLVAMLVCRADPFEREVLLGIGHPFFPPRGGVDRVGIVLDDGTDWTEIAELVTESYRLLAPRKLASLLDAPPPA